MVLLTSYLSLLNSITSRTDYVLYTMGASPTPAPTPSPCKGGVTGANGWCDETQCYYEHLSLEVRAVWYVCIAFYLLWRLYLRKVPKHLRPSCVPGKAFRVEPTEEAIDRAAKLHDQDEEAGNKRQLMIAHATATAAAATASASAAAGGTGGIALPPHGARPAQPTQPQRSNKPQRARAGAKLVASTITGSGGSNGALRL